MHARKLYHGDPMTVSTKQTLQLLEQFDELLVNFSLLELFAMLTKSAVAERDALELLPRLSE